MIRSAALFSFLLFAFNLSSMDLLTIRKKFYAAAEDEKMSAEFLAYLNTVEQGSPLISGYKGMAHMLMAKHVFSPYTKSMHFLKGKKLLDESVEIDKTNAELRFLRLTVQVEAPFFLNYSSDIREDISVIRAALPQLGDQDLKRRIEAFFQLKDLNLEGLANCLITYFLL